MTALELTPAEQAAMQTDSHVAFCQTPLGQCVACMAVYRKVKKVIEAVTPVIEAEQAQSMERIRTQAEIAALRWAADRIDPGPASTRRTPVNDLDDMQMTCDRGVATRLRLWANLRVDGAPVAAGAEALEGAAAGGEPEGRQQS